MCNMHIFNRSCSVKRNVQKAHMLGILDPFLAALARLLVARGVLFPDFADRMKAHFVAAAEQQGKATDSRLSVLTGLQRRDIVRLRGALPRDQRPNHLSRLVALWQTDPLFGGGPLPRSGDVPSFEALARMVRKDVHPRTMLDTLLASGTVALEEGGQQVRLVQASYQPLAGSEDQLAYLSRNLGDHMTAATANVLGQTPPHFERAVHYSDLTEAEVAELRSMHHKGQMALFQALSATASAMKRNDGRGSWRFRAGAWFLGSREET